MLDRRQAPSVDSVTWLGSQWAAHAEQRGVGAESAPAESGRRMPRARRRGWFLPHALEPERLHRVPADGLCSRADAPDGSAGPESLAPGKLVAGRYRIEQTLGRGGMGEVYAAFDLLLRELVALKTLLGATADEPSAIRALMTEARIGRSIGHPNVCRVHDVGTHEEPERRDAFFHFMTMELIDGERLTSRLRAGPLHWRDARTIARQILLGLEAVHAARVLHRDLKSDNVMLARSGSETRAVVMDFGLSYLLDVPGQVAHSDCAGSVAYMAPEQLEGRALGIQTDVFAFGVVLFEMLTGARPFSPDGDTLRDTARKRRASPPTAPSALCPELPAAFDQIVLTCLSPRVSERYPDARCVLQALAATPP